MDVPGIVVTGASGRMGRMLVETVRGDPRVRLAGAVVREGHDWIGRDLGEAMGGAAIGVTVTADPVEAIAGAQGILDFTTPEASLGFAELAAQARAVHVIGTTGFTAEQIARLKPAARHAPIIRAGNMSLGVNLLVGVTRRVAAALGEDWDIEVVEAHHRMKVDAPSGTALFLGEAAAKGYGWNLRETAVDGRTGLPGERPEKEIGFHAVRGGDIVGDHSVLFAADGECLELAHRATSRDTLAIGALRAAAWIPGRAPGLYHMRHVLGLEPGGAP